jgi:hypothetical protein
MRRMRYAVMLCAISSVCAVAETPPSALKLRKVVNHELVPDAPAVPVPPEAVRVYAYEGEALGVWINPETIAAQYPRSGVVFDRKTGQVLRRYTVADGWPLQKQKEFPTALPDPMYSRRLDGFVGPGILETQSKSVRPRPGDAQAATEEHAVATSIEFNGRIWQAMQPVGGLEYLFGRAGNNRFGTHSWTAILRAANSESFLESRPKDGVGKTVRYTMKDGLASNLITHLAVADGKLWAACVDIYEPDKTSWGMGGLCVYDPKTSAWTRINKVAGKPVRWVTIMQKSADDLWIGFREGNDVVGDSISYGMGVYAGQYRPVATAITVARLSKGIWTAFSRPPLESTTALSVRGDSSTASGETPRMLAILNDRLVLFSQYQNRHMTYRNTDWTGLSSMLDMKTGKWQTWDAQKDFAAYELKGMVAEDGEVIVLTDKGLRRWQDDKQKWVAPDAHSPLVNSSISAVTRVGNELWVGYGIQSADIWGGSGVIGRQGISRFNEEKKEWFYASPKEIGTTSPVRCIFPLKNGDVLTLFREQSLSKSEIRLLYSEPRGPSGLGRFKNGKWEFPITLLDIIPKNEIPPRELQGSLPTLDMTVVGGKVYVLRSDGIYEGPDKWRRVYTAPGNDWWLLASEDGKKLEINQIPEEGNEPQNLRQLIYDPVTGKTTDVTNRSSSTITPFNISKSSAIPSKPKLASDWTEFTNKEGSWAIGPLGHVNGNRVVQTPWAVWIIKQGELIRLDRAMLDKILKP